MKLSKIFALFGLLIVSQILPFSAACWILFRVAFSINCIKNLSTRNKPCPLGDTKRWCSNKSSSNSKLSLVLFIYRHYISRIYRSRINRRIIKNHFSVAQNQIDFRRLQHFVARFYFFTVHAHFQHHIFS